MSDYSDSDDEGSRKKKGRVSVQGVESVGGHFACLCRGFEFYDVNFFFVINDYLIHCIY